MVSKITSPITPLEEVAKINEIIDGKQDTLVSGTNIKTINNTSILGSGNIAFPTVDQTYSASSTNAQSGVAINGAKFLRNTATGSNAVTILGNATTAGSAVNIGYGSSVGGGGGVAIGRVSSTSGSFSTALGYSAKASANYAIQLGYGTNSTASTLAVGFNNTNYQLLDGTTGKIPSDRIPIDNSTITVNSSGQLMASGGGGSVDVDNKSITTNSSDEIQTVGVINSRDSSTAIKTWTGTKAQYDAITTKDSATLYNITDDTDVSLTILEALYPVGSVYITTANTCPLSSLISGSTWTQETCRQLVEKKEPTDNDPSWYNLYSDGWCEQGGTYSNSSSHTQDFVFLKPFKDTNYQVFTGSTYSSNGGTDHQESMSEFVSRSTTGFRKYIWVNTNNLWWQACGYTSATTSHKQFRRTA